MIKVIATDGRAVDEKASAECCERISRKKRVPSGNKNPSVKRDWGQPMRPANDNKPIELGRFNPAGVWRPKELPIPANDNVSLSPSQYRAKLDAWRAKHPEPDNQILPRANRNISARRAVAPVRLACRSNDDGFA
jgi:hypothetical protein